MNHSSELYFVPVSNKSYYYILNEKRIGFAMYPVAYCGVITIGVYNVVYINKEIPQLIYWYRLISLVMSVRSHTLWEIYEQVQCFNIYLAW
jgi:hypothetical protein